MSITIGRLGFAIAKSHQSSSPRAASDSSDFWSPFWDAGPWLVLIIGLAATIGVGVLVELMRRAQEDAYRLVDELERKHTELDRSERRYRELVERIPLVTYVDEARLDGATLYISPQLTPLTGVTTQEYIDDPNLWRTLVHPDDLQRVDDDTVQHLSTGLPVTSEYRFVARDGSVRWVTDQAVLNEIDGVLVSSGYLQDITERKELESRLQQVQRMEAVGLLAGGIAHDFNNILSVITVSSQSLLNEMAPDDPGRLDVEAIARASERVASLTRQLVAFSRRQVLRPERLDVNETVTSMERMLSRLFGVDVELVTNLYPEPCFVEVDPGQLEQVIINLAVNARDAMPAGGILTLVTELGVLDDGTEAVVMLVSDTGQGIDATVLGRVFEPFFTTKEAGKGTGLGLATVYGIVQQSRGAISVESELGVGTTFEIVLPRMAAPPPVSAAATAARRSPASPGGSLRILLVEDSDDVRRVTRRLLASLGHEVHEAVDGEHALVVLSTSGIVDLVVTDVAMPTMGGVELVNRIRAGSPDVPVIYMSGFPGPESDGMVQTDGRTVFVAKPFTPAELVEAIAGLTSSS